eukprot:GEZU01033626.1.p1 GENE.GEZU01033626.1~~GEZU01033626.1.p1  ORF type:complete len:201 (+),score=55.12 GEZU01033626.1:105-707(+)
MRRFKKRGSVHDKTPPGGEQHLDVPQDAPEGMKRSGSATKIAEMLSSEGIADVDETFHYDAPEKTVSRSNLGATTTDATTLKTALEEQAGKAREEADSIRVLFSVHYSTNPGEHLRIVGNKICDWDPSKGSDMMWAEGNNWVIEKQVLLADKNDFEYKFIVVTDEGDTVLRWEGGNNHKLNIPKQVDRGELFITRENWNE